MAEGLGTPTPLAAVLKDKTRALVQSEQVAPRARGQGVAEGPAHSPAPGQGACSPAPIRLTPLGTRGTQQPQPSALGPGSGCFFNGSGLW